MGKKAQVTIFIILGLIIISVFGILFLLKYENIKNYFESLNVERLNVPPQIKSINDFIGECFKSSSDEALYFIGQHGGYYNERVTGYEGIPYYLAKNELLIPKKEKIENEISEYINDAFIICINNFEIFPGFEITKGIVKTKTFVSYEKVSFKLEYPLTIKKQKTAYQLKSFNYEVPLRLEMIYNVSSFIVNEHLANKDEICLSCLIELSSKNELYLIARAYDNNVTVYAIADQKYYLDENRFSSDIAGFGNYNFKFAVND